MCHIGDHPSNESVAVELVVPIMVFDQGQESLQPVVEVGEFPTWWLEAGGMVKTVDDDPANGTDRQAGSQGCQGDVQESGNRRGTLPGR